MIEREQLLTSDDWRFCAQTLYREAELLDDRRYRDWLELIDDEIDYRLLNRITAARECSAPAHTPDDYHVRCGRKQLEARIARVETGWSFADDPPAATRRMISNVRPVRGEAELVVKSNLLMIRSRWETTALVSGERHDVWRDAGGRLLLSKRWIYLDQTSLTIENLGLIL